MLVLLLGGGVLVVDDSANPDSCLECESGHVETNPCAGCRSARNATAEAMELTRTSLLLVIFSRFFLKPSLRAFDG